VQQRLRRRRGVHGWDLRLLGGPDALRRHVRQPAGRPAAPATTTAGPAACAMRAAAHAQPRSSSAARPVATR
jgi:hypothetical protein